MSPPPDTGDPANRVVTHAAGLTAGLDCLPAFLHPFVHVPEAEHVTALAHDCRFTTAERAAVLDGVTERARAALDTLADPDEVWRRLGVHSGAIRDQPEELAGHLPESTVAAWAEVERRRVRKTKAKERRKRRRKHGQCPPGMPQGSADGSPRTLRPCQHPRRPRGGTPCLGGGVLRRTRDPRRGGPVDRTGRRRRARPQGGLLRTGPGAIRAEGFRGTAVVQLPGTPPGSDPRFSRCVGGAPRASGGGVAHRRGQQRMRRRPVPDPRPQRRRRARRRLGGLRCGGVRKPERRLFEIAARRCGASLGDGGWMVGDSPAADAVGGQRAGLRTVWVERGRPWPGELPGPDHSVSDVREAFALLLA